MVHHMVNIGPTVTTAEAAARLGVHVNTVNRMAKDGRLTPVVKGPGLRGAYVFTEAEVDRVKRERTAAAA